jgi:hypothetical protein
MSKLISNIAKQYSNLQSSGVSRNTAFGVVYNNTIVSGIRLNDHPNGKRVTGQVLQALGFEDVKSVEGDLDSL